MNQIQLRVSVCVSVDFHFLCLGVLHSKACLFAYFIMIKSAANRPLSTGNTKVNKIKENKLKQDKVI